MSFKSTASLCLCLLVCLVDLGADAIGNRPFKSKEEVQAAGNKFKPFFGRLGLPCALAGKKCFDKESICVDVGAGKRDMCQCEEKHLQIEGKCRPKPADEDNVTEASYAGCPFAATLAKQHNKEKNKKKMPNLAVEAAASVASS